MIEKLLLIAVVLAGACHGKASSTSGDPVKDAWTKACHAHEHVDTQVDRPERSLLIAQWILQNVREPSVLRAFAAASALAPADKAPFIRDAAAKAGLTSCPVADAL